jgi:hypothetical protein
LKAWVDWDSREAQSDLLPGPSFRKLGRNSKYGKSAKKRAVFSNRVV